VKLKFDNTNIIPLHVYVTWNTNLPPSLKKNYINLRKKNPEFNFHLYDEAQCRSCIQSFFPSALESFDSLIPSAYKANLWSLCVLYQFGGIYMDCTIECLGNFKLYSLIDKEHFVMDTLTITPHIYDGLMVCKPNNPFLLESIGRLIKNVKSNYYGESPLSPTGSEMLGRIGSQTQLNLDMVLNLRSYITYKNVVILKKNDYHEQVEHYSTMWKNKNIYIKHLIPLNVYVTWKTLDLPPKMKQNYINLRKKNPEFNFHLYDEVRCRNFIQTYFPSAVDAFDSLIPGAYKADLWRLCVLYQFGGIYMDGTLECLGNFKLYSLIDKEHFVIDRQHHSPHIYNAFMVCNPNNPFLIEAIEQIIKNVTNKYYGESYVSPTGSEMLGRIAPKHSLNVDMHHSRDFDTHIMYKNVAILKNYDGYKGERLQFYSNMWKNKNIYEYNERLEKSIFTNIYVTPVIPLDVYLTWKTIDLPPRMKHHYTKLCNHNPEFNFHLYDDTQCRDFIQAYFPNALETFDKLIPGAYKADLWRLCVLYQFGGIYMDCKIECIGNFKLYNLVDKEHFVIDRNNSLIYNHSLRVTNHSSHIYNAFMVCKPNNPFLLESIEQIIKNVKSNYYGESPLSPTGPEMLGRIACKYSLNLDIVHSQEINKHIMYNNVAILKNYDGYYEERSIN
jgi:mannosyltransferase OCH1-like enzyme